jgi:hypothetical protein
MTLFSLSSSWTDDSISIDLLKVSVLISLKYQYWYPLLIFCYHPLAVLWFDYKNSKFENKWRTYITETYVLNREKILLTLEHSVLVCKFSASIFSYVQVPSILFKLMIFTYTKMCYFHSYRWTISVPPKNLQGSTRLKVWVNPSPLPLYGLGKMRNTWSLFC